MATRTRQRTGSGRRFSWARAVGAIGVAGGPVVRFGGVDLLADVRATYGNDTFRGSTVCAVKGFVRPNLSLQTGFTTGVFGIRVCNAGDLVAPVGVEQTPGGALGQEADWLWYLPFVNDDAGTPDDAVATSNMGYNKWSLDTQSVRRMDEQAQTLGLFFWMSAGNAIEASPIDFHLSIGLRV